MLVQILIILQYLMLILLCRDNSQILEIEIFSDYFRHCQLFACINKLKI